MYYDKLSGKPKVNLLAKILREIETISCLKSFMPRNIRKGPLK